MKNTVPRNEYAGNRQVFPKFPPFYVTPFYPPYPKGDIEGESSCLDGILKERVLILNGGRKILPPCPS
jgi:hypothetical protein